MILNLNSANMTGNKAGKNGGAIYSAGNVVIQSSLNTIYNNKAEINGGGIYLGKPSQTLTSITPRITI